MAECARILLLGKTGAGKSSFINYFLGRHVAKTGYGEPVTQEFFAPYLYTRGRYPVEVVDTKGLEALGAAEQKDKITQEIQKRNNSEDVYDWFHTIFYCVSLDTPRFEDFEAQFILDLRRDLSQHIHIILTHCDNKPAERRQVMHDEIRGKLGGVENLEIFEVTSVEMKKRSGLVLPQGREVIAERVFELLVEDIADRLSEQYARLLHGAQVQTVTSSLARFRDFVSREVNPISISAGLKELERKGGQITAEIEQGIVMAQKMAGDQLARVLRPACELYRTYWSVLHEEGQLPVFAREDLAAFCAPYHDFQMDDDELMRYIAPHVADAVKTDPDDMSLWELLQNIFNGVLDLLWIRTNVLRAIDQIEKKMLAEVPARSEIRRRAHDSIAAYLVGKTDRLAVSEPVLRLPEQHQSRSRRAD